ncbi:MAG: hypothetical protein RLZZ308_137 [Candidatus Parcubacteria bacterium]|jgi:hypothetical protein
MSFLKDVESYFLDTKEFYVIRFSPVALLSFVLFFSFGLYGYYTNPVHGWLLNTAFTSIFLSLFLFLLYSKEKFSLFYFTVTYGHLRLFFLHCSTLLVFVSPYIFLPISSDNFYHTQQALVYGIKIIEVGSRYLPFLNNVQFSLLLQILSLCFIVVGILVVFLLRNTSFFIKASIYGLLFILARTSVLFLGGNTAGFPPFRLLPLFLSSSFFGISDLALRLASFIPITIFSVIIFEILRKKIYFIYAFLGWLSILTIPLLLHVGTLVESSLWAFFAFFTLLFFISKKDQSTESYGVIMTFISIASYMRVSVFIAIIPLMLHFLLVKKRSFAEIANVTKYALPGVVALVPLVIISIIQGSPATYRGEAYPLLGIKETASFFERLSVAFYGGYIDTSLYNSLYVLMYIPLLLVVLVVRKVLFIYGVFFITAVAIFFSISPGLWGNGRYQAEYALPLVVLTYILLYQRVHNYFISVVSVILITCNCFIFFRLPSLNSSLVGFNSYFEHAKNKGHYFVLSEMPYEYQSLLEDFKKQGFGHGVYYLPGNGYSYMAKIMSGFSVSQMVTEKRFRDAVGVVVSSSTSLSLNKEKDIHYLLISRAPKEPYFSNEILVKNLDKKIWILEKRYVNKTYGTITEIYHRNTF